MPDRRVGSSSLRSFFIAISVVFGVCVRVLLSFYFPRIACVEPSFFALFFYSDTRKNTSSAWRIVFVGGREQTESDDVPSMFMIRPRFFDRFFQAVSFVFRFVQSVYFLQRRSKHNSISS